MDKRDREEAKQNFELVTETDRDGIAEYELFILHREDNPYQARNFLERAVMKKLRKAQYKLGLILEKEPSQDSNNLVKVCALYRQSAKQGFRKAQYKYACCCHDGKGTQENIERAKKWFIKSATQGYSKAMMTLQNLGLYPQFSLFDL